MTQEEKMIVLKDESEARSIIAQLGLCVNLQGTLFIKELILGIKKVKELTDLEVEAILASWESRHYVPIKLINPEEEIQVMVDNVKLSIIEGEKEIEYKRRKVELISMYIKTIPG